jgi:hypothetical protein
MKKHQNMATTDVAAACAMALWAAGGSVLVSGRGKPSSRDPEQDLERLSGCLKVARAEAVLLLVYLRTRIHNWVVEVQGDRVRAGPGEGQSAALMIEYLADWIDAIPEVFFAVDEAVAAGKPVKVALPQRPRSLMAALELQGQALASGDLVTSAFSELPRWAGSSDAVGEGAFCHPVPAKACGSAQQTASMRLHLPAVKHVERRSVSQGHRKYNLGRRASDRDTPLRSSGMALVAARHSSRPEA